MDLSVSISGVPEGSFEFCTEEEADQYFLRMFCTRVYPACACHI